MFKSIINDIKDSFDYGNMITKLIIINITVFVITALINAFFPAFYQANIFPYLALSGDPLVLLYRPWTVISHMFVHEGMWHLIWNMLTLFWFGNIVGDLLGDKRILPIYILGGLMGALFFVVSAVFLPGIGSFAIGASAATMAMVFSALATAPDYIMNLILIGNVRIKYIGFVILFLDIIGTQGMINSGGHFAHLGGTLFGLLFVYSLRNGLDFSYYFNKATSFFKLKKEPQKRPNSKLKVAHRSDNIDKLNTPSRESKPSESSVDQILEKIKQKGYESLTPEEKDVLYKASKN